MSRFDALARRVRAVEGGRPPGDDLVQALQAAASVAASSGCPPEDVARFGEIVDELTVSACSCELDGLRVSAHPFRGAPWMRVVEESWLEPEFAARCARRGTSQRVVWLDPTELDYRNYDHILPIDDALADFDLAGSYDIPLTWESPVDGVWVGRLASDALILDALRHLDGLDLYMPPLNGGGRGGGRSILWSDVLGRWLTECMWCLTGAFVDDGAFERVNPVFRLNRFEANSRGFSRHVDTPYRDPVALEASHYTLLVYLTGGEGAPGEPALWFEDFEMQRIEPGTVVIFDQSREHAGASFVDGPKVFLRSELVHAYSEFDEASEVGECFSRACYLAMESLRLPQLEPYMARQFDLAARAHAACREGFASQGGQRTTLLKRFLGVPFLTNGCDVWFRADDLDVRQGAAIAILDFFNCRLGEGVFKDLCEVEIVEGDVDDARAQEILGAEGEAAEVGRPFSLDVLCPASSWGGDDHMTCPEDPDVREFEAWRAPDVIRFYEAAREHTLASLSRAPVWFMGQRVWLNPDAFVLTRGLVHVLSFSRVEPVHFAAFNAEYHCWREHEPGDFVAADRFVGSIDAMLPPIPWRRVGDLVHLHCVMFRNEALVSLDRREVPVPSIASENVAARGAYEEYDANTGGWFVFDDD